MLTADQEKLRAKSLVIESTKHLSHAHTHTHHPNRIATSTATRHGGTHRGNRLLRATAAHTQNQFNLVQICSEHLHHLVFVALPLERGRTSARTLQ